MKGRIWKHHGTWQVIIVSGRKPDGQEQRNYYTCHSQEEAERTLHEKMSELYAGTYTEPTKLTLAAFCTQWLEADAAMSLRRATYLYYQRMLRLHVWPLIGGMLLADLRPLHIQRVLAAAQRKGLSPKTVQHVRTTIRRVLGQAVLWGLLARNPAAGKQVKVPPLGKQEIHIWTPDEAQRFLDAAQGHWLYAFYHLALSTGMRRGELIGLQWRDLDLTSGTVSVRQAATFDSGKAELGEVKTAAGVRTITIGERAVAVLKEHRIRGQHGAIGPQVFPANGGGILSATTARRVMVRYEKRAGVPHIPLHGLRHTHATWLLAAGIHPKVVAERLGHADVGITLNRYSHLLPNLQKEAAQAVDRFLR